MKGVLARLVGDDLARKPQRRVGGAGGGQIEVQALFVERSFLAVIRDRLFQQRREFEGLEFTATAVDRLPLGVDQDGRGPTADAEN